jgi:hypothetical protein
MIADISNPQDIEYRSASLPDDGYNYNPNTTSWAPDGELVALRRVKSFNGFDSDYALCAFNPNGGFYSVLVPPETGFQLDFVCDWSPNGQYILINVYDGVQEYWAYNPKRQEFTQITFAGNDQWRIYNADWGLNGQIIFSVFDYEVYLDNPEGDYENIYVIDG